MKLSYIKLRKVLTIFLKSKELRAIFDKLFSNGEISISEMEFVDMLAESSIDLEVLAVLSETEVENLSAEQAMELFSDFFISIKSSWKVFKDLFLNLGLKPEAKMNMLSKN
jgi:hypothetical protein